MILSDSERFGSVQFLESSLGVSCLDVEYMPAGFLVNDI